MQDRAARRATDAMNDYNSPAAQRERLESAGFNPAAYLQGAGNQAMPAATGHIGQAMAEAAGIAAGYFNDRHREQSQLVKVQEQNAKLQERLRDALLRPAVGGVFGGGDKPLASPVMTDPLLAPIMQGEKPEVDPMKNEAFFRQVRIGAGEPYLVPSEPDLDEFLVNSAFIGAQDFRRRNRANQKYMQDFWAGRLTAEQKAKSLDGPTRTIANFSPLGAIISAGKLVGYDLPWVHEMGRKK